MKLSFFPKNDVFFDLFNRSAHNIHEAAEYFLQIVRDYTKLEEKVHHLKELESKGDSITHEIIDRLNSSFITPLDREDIYALAGNLDDVLDEIEGVGNRMLLFAVEQPTTECVELVRIISEAAALIELAILNLRHFKGLQEFLIQIHTLENQADQITRKMTAKLFHECTEESEDVMNLIKWKEIYARLEHTADRLEDVANVIEDIVVKNT